MVYTDYVDQMVKLGRLFRFSAIFGLSFWVVACTPPRAQVYLPDLPEKTTQEIESVLREKFPKAELQFTRGDVSGVRFDSDTTVLLLTSDPWVWRDLKVRNQLACGLLKESPRGLKSELRDSQLCSWGVSVSLGVLFFDPGKVSTQELPQRWSDLGNAHWKNRIYWPFADQKSRLGLALNQLRRQRGSSVVDAASKNSSRTVGADAAGVWMGLAEDLSDWKSRGRAVRVLYPLDGVLAVPTRVGVLHEGADSEFTQKFLKAFFSAAVQNVFARSGYYPAVEGMVTRDDLRPWSELSRGPILWVTE